MFSKESGSSSKNRLADYPNTDEAGTSNAIESSAVNKEAQRGNLAAVYPTKRALAA